jgi:uncharacterized protein (UPF0262 family)
MSVAAINIADENMKTVPDHVRREQTQTLQELRSSVCFCPHGINERPFYIEIGLHDHRLILTFSAQPIMPLKTEVEPANENAYLNSFVLALKPYRRIIQDYFLMIESYQKARISASADKLEAIDMARRGLHNEGAELLMDRLYGKIELDFDTARRLFTLICTLTRQQAVM